MTDSELKIGIHPPFTWYTGIAFHRQNEGIRSVFVSREFISLFDKEEGTPMFSWWDSNNRLGKLSDSEKKMRDDAEAVIEKRTGFPIQEIEGFRRELNREYTGKQEAPFPIEWMDEPS